MVTARLRSSAAKSAWAAALEAAPKVYIADPDLMAAFDGLDAAEVFRTSQATLVAGEAGPAASAWPRRTASRLSPWAEGRNAPGPGVSCRKWVPTRAILTFPCATPMRWPPGTQPMERARMTGVIPSLAGRLSCWPLSSSSPTRLRSAGSSISCVGFADPDTRLGFAYVMNSMDYYMFDDPREKALRDAVHRAIRRLSD